MSKKRGCSSKFKDEILKLKNEGYTYNEIADELGIHRETVKYWLTPGRRKSQVNYSIIHNTKKSKNNLEFRCKISIYASRNAAKKNNYLPCLTNTDELVKAFTGYCYICNIKESDCTRRLHMDHCHKTGKFRGWLCKNCNTLLGNLENNNKLNKIINYLSL